MSAYQHRLEAAIKAARPNPIPLDRIAHLVAANGYAPEMDFVVSANRALRDDPELWDYLGAHTRRLNGAVANRDGVRALMMMKNGAKPTAQTLQLACATNSRGIAEELLARGVHVTSQHLFSTIDANNPRMLELLLEWLQVQEPPVLPPTSRPRRRRPEDPMPTLEQLNATGLTPLFYAVAEGRAECVWALVDAGADVNAVRWIAEEESDEETPAPFPFLRGGWGRRQTVLDLAETGAHTHSMQIARFLRRHGAERAPVF